MSTHPLLAISPFLVLCGCALLLTEETKYLQAAQNHATQMEVLKHFGEPDEIQRSETGEASWRYDIYRVEGGSQQSWAAMGSWCDRYILSFDAQGVLRNWAHRSYAHGGENMPINCDDGNEKQAL